MTAPVRDDESLRLSELRRYLVLDTPGEEAFDGLTRLALQTCGGRVALISLVDGDRVWFKSRVGTARTEIPRDGSLCADAILEHGFFTVPDALNDGRYAANAFVVEDGLRFYAGVALRSSTGHALGTLCVMDTAPLELTPEQRDALATLASQAVAQLELKREIAERHAEGAAAAGRAARIADFGSRVMDSATNAVAALDQEGRFLYVNRRGLEMTGFGEHDLIGKPFADVISPQSLAGLSSSVARVLTEGAVVRDIEAELRRKDGSTAIISASMGPLTQNGAIVGLAGTAEDITDRKRSEALISWQCRMLETIVAGGSLDVMLLDIATHVEEQTATSCSIRLFDEETKTLTTGAAPSLPASFVAALEGLRVGPNVGSCGTAAYRLAPVITRDVHTDPLWEQFRPLMEAHGLHSAWSTPILRGDSVLFGTLAMYSPEPRTPGEWDMRVIEVATHVAALAIGRVRIRERSRDSEARYRLLWETSMDAIVLLDAACRIRFANPAVARVFGYSPEELVGQQIAMLQPEAARDAHRAGRARYLATGKKDLDSSAIRTIGQHRDGHEFPIEIAFSDVQSAGGTLVAAFIRDVTAQSHAHEALQRSEQRYRVLAESALDLVCELDTEGRFVYASPNFQPVLGYEPSDLIGRVAFSLIHPEDTQRVGTEFADAVQNSGTGTSTFRVRRADDSWCWLESSANFVTTSEGHLHAVIVSRDITQRRQMEDSLRASEERLRTFVRNAPVILFALDAEGVFTLYEGAGLLAVGLQPEQFVGRSVYEVHARNEPIIANSKRCLAGEAFVETVTIRDVSFEAHHTPLLDDGGNVTGMIGVLINITDRRRAESLLQMQRQLLEMVAVGAPLLEVLERLAEQVEAHARGGLCSIHLTTEDGMTLAHGVAPSLSEAFNAAADGIPIGDGVGSCGTAAFRREPVIVADIASDPLWRDYVALAEQEGIRACWSLPVLSTDGEVLGTLAVYYRDVREPDDADRDLIEMASRIAAIAIERKHAEEAVRARTIELEESKKSLEEKSILLERALETERDRARRDPLTGLYNHAAITGLLRDFVGSPAVTTLAVAMVDVDGLKAANDTYGHQVGDAVLVTVAEKLSRPGVFVGRYGGDEFIAILPSADRATAEAYRDEVLASLSEAGLTDDDTGADVPVVASMGLAVYPEEAAAVDDLIRLSDSAMYASRRQRPEGAPGRTLTRTLGGDRAAKMVGEIVPLLTSPGNIDDKLRLVSHRLSVGAGYDGVHFVIDRQQAVREPEMASSAFARVPDEQLREWNEYQSKNPNRIISRILARTRRPIIIDDIASTELMPEDSRSGLVAVGLHSCLVAPMFWEDELIGALSVASKRHAAFSVRDAEFVGAVATQVTAIVQMSRLLERLQTSSAHLKAAHESTVLMLASAAEAHDRTTGRHLERVRRITEALAAELDYEPADAHELGLAATLHDIGKIRVPDAVLGSSQSLAEAEWVLMKQHTLWGAAFLDGQPGFELAVMVARCHHERWDGQGYPDGLAADEIPAAAQITTVADSFDAMTSDRPYRDGRPTSDAVDEIVACAGTQFSPRVVDALVRLFERGDLNFLHHDYREHSAAA